MLNWLFDERAITEAALAEVHAVLKSINPVFFAVLSPAESPSMFGRKLGEIFQAYINLAAALTEEIEDYKRRVGSVERSLDTLRERCATVEEPLWQKISSLESQVKYLESGLRTANCEKERLEQQLSSLTVLNASLEAQIVDLNRLVAKQHRRLAELIGAGPELP